MPILTIRFQLKKDTAWYFFLKVYLTYDEFLSEPPCNGKV